MWSSFLSLSHRKSWLHWTNHKTRNSTLATLRLPTYHSSTMKPNPAKIIRSERMNFLGVKCSKKLGHVGSMFWTEHVAVGWRVGFSGAPTVETSSFGRSQMQFFKLNASTYYEDEFEIFSPAMEFSFCFHIQNVVKNTFTILAYHASCQQNLTRNLDRWQNLTSPTKLLRMVGRTQALYPKIVGALKSQTPKKKTLAICSDHTKLPFWWGFVCPTIYYRPWYPHHRHGLCI